MFKNTSIVKAMKWFITLSALISPAAAFSKRSEQPVISATDLRKIQIRTFKSPSELVFAQVLNVLIDRGYMTEQVDRIAGVITATGASLTKMSGLGLSTRKTTIKVAAFVQSLPAGETQLRFNIIENYQYNYNGRPYRNEDTVVTTASSYEPLFTAIETALPAIVKGP